MSKQKVCPSCTDQTGGRPTPHAVRDGKWICGLCGHETPKRTRVTKKSRDMEDLIKRLSEARPVNNPHYDETERAWDERKAAWEKEQAKKKKQQQNEAREPGKPYVKPHRGDGKTQTAWKASDKWGKVKYFGMDFKKAAEKHAFKEEAPTMAASSGKVAGIGVGPQGEPGVKRTKYKKDNVIMTDMIKRKMKTFEQFIKGE